MEVRVTDKAATYGLRQSILRPHQTVEEMVWPGDDHPDAIHLVAFESHDPIGMVSFMPLLRIGSRARMPFRLRGMGVVPSRRSQGVGTALLDRGAELVHAAGGDEIWCHARERAVPFYERHEFETVGAYWDEPVIGPHVVMVRRLEIASS